MFTFDKIFFVISQLFVFLLSQLFIFTKYGNMKINKILSILSSPSFKDLDNLFKNLGDNETKYYSIVNNISDIFNRKSKAYYSNNLELYKKLLDSGKLTSKNTISEIFEWTLGFNVYPALFNESEKYRHMNKHKIVGIFREELMVKYMKICDSLLKEEFNKMKKDKEIIKKNGTFDSIVAIVIKIFYRLCFGENPNSHEYNVFEKISIFRMSPSFSTILNILYNRNFISQHIEKYINKSNEETFIYQMKYMGLNNDQIVGEVIDIFSVNVSLVAHSLNNALYYLTVDEDIQNEIRNEICNYQNFDYNIINSIKIIDNFVKEVYRFCPGSSIVPTNKLTTGNFFRFNFLSPLKKISFWGERSNIFDPKRFDNYDHVEPEIIKKGKYYEITKKCEYIPKGMHITTNEGYTTFGYSSRRCTGETFMIQFTKIFFCRFIKSMVWKPVNIAESSIKKESYQFPPQPADDLKIIIL
jgi:hypothetical protein